VSYRRDVPKGQAARLARARLRQLIGARPTEQFALQLITSVAVIGGNVLTIRPLGWSGRGLIIASLLAVNGVLMLSRRLPDTLVMTGPRIVLLCLGAVAAATLVGAADDGIAYLFAYYVAGHAGYRLRTAPAMAVAALTGGLSGGVLLLHWGPGHQNVPWPVGAASAFAVLIGMVNRSRQEVYQSQVLAAQSGQRAAEAEAREAVLTERARIARDLHDVLAHSLAGTNMQLELADALLDVGDLERARQATRRAHSLVRAGLLESQRTVHALRAEALPLVDTLRAMLDSSGHPGRLDVSGTTREIDARSAQTLIRIAQESLTNAARHAPEAAVQVTLSYAPAVITLEVGNEARVDRPGAGPGSGLGLVGMRERAALLGGTVTAGPVTEGRLRGGWRVQAIIPG
jgi:signal transduction histidine kinase